MKHRYQKLWSANLIQCFLIQVTDSQLFRSNATFVIFFYYINTSEIPGELPRVNMISSHVKITCYLHAIFTSGKILIAVIT